MHISALTSYNIPSGTKNKKVCTAARQDKKNIKNGCSDISFGSNTSAGNTLRTLVNIRCPYNGVKIIPGSQEQIFKRRLMACKNAEDVVNLLSPYRKSFLRIERSVYGMFREFASKNPKGSIIDCLQGLYSGCLSRLRMQEYAVIDDVDNLVAERMKNSLSAKTVRDIRSKTAKFRTIIDEENPSERFKRQVFIGELDMIPHSEDENAVFLEIRGKALNLPNSGNSKDAFVVKYADLPPEAAVRRVFSGSLATIEHIKPHSKGGANDINNFLLTTADGNNYRESMPLPDYIRRHKRIPEFAQQYIDDVIANIVSRKWLGHEDYPYNVRRTLLRESDNLINLNLSQYYSEEEAKEMARQYAEMKHSMRGYLV